MTTHALWARPRGRNSSFPTQPQLTFVSATNVVAARLP